MNTEQGAQSTSKHTPVQGCHIYHSHPKIVSDYSGRASEAIRGESNKTSWLQKGPPKSTALHLAGNLYSSHSLTGGLKFLCA